MVGRMIHAELRDLPDLHCRGLNGGGARRDAGSLVALLSEREGHRRRIRGNRKAESVPPSRAIAGPTAPFDRIRALSRRSASKRQRGKRMERRGMRGLCPTDEIYAVCVRFQG